MAPFVDRLLPAERSRRVSALLAAVVRCLAVFESGRAAFAVDVPLTPDSVVRFADVAQGIDAITQRDDYILQQGPLERQIRMQSANEVSQQDFLDFISKHVIPWQTEDIQKLTPAIEGLRAKIEPWKLNLPKVILLVKTDGREEAGAAYCRGAAIVLPQNMLAGTPEKLLGLLSHELFHILSRTNPELREALYESIGFKACNEVELPDALKQRKITNPDAPVNKHYITVEQNGQPMELMCLLVSKTDRYDPTRNTPLFGYLEFKLMQLTNDGGVRRPALVDGQPVLLDPKSVPGFTEQIGRNTAYVIHPEEILADNFVHLLNGRIDLQTPRVVERMGTILQAAAKR